MFHYEKEGERADMDTTLHGASLALDTQQQNLEVQSEAEEAEHHIHLPNPSLWPVMLTVAITVEVMGLLFIPDNPWLCVVAAPFILLGILGWALEDPMGSAHAEAETEVRRGPIPPAMKVLDEARAIAERHVTLSSTEFSTHPVKVELESDQGKEGVVLALYGKVELATQRQELERALRDVYGVLDVKNFLIAEDEILSMCYARIENMRSQGKLDGAQNISVLVENYILHIYGDVPNNKMKYTLERELIGVPGVRVVVNHIGLNKEIPGNLGKTANKVGV